MIKDSIQHVCKIASLLCCSGLALGKDQTALTFRNF